MFLICVSTGFLEVFLLKLSFSSQACPTSTRFPLPMGLGVRFKDPLKCITQLSHSAGGMTYDVFLLFQNLYDSTGFLTGSAVAGNWRAGSTLAILVFFFFFFFFSICLVLRSISRSCTARSFYFCVLPFLFFGCFAFAAAAAARVNISRPSLSFLALGLASCAVYWLLLHGHSRAAAPLLRSALPSPPPPSLLLLRRRRGGRGRDGPGWGGWGAA